MGFFSRKNAIVIYPPDKGGIKYEHRNGNVGHQRRHKNSQMYLLISNGNGLEPYIPPDTFNQHPVDLYDALNWEAAKRQLSYKNTLMEKINMVMNIILVAILCFVIFLIIDGMAGG